VDVSARNILELKNRLAGEDVYVVASGSSIDHILKQSPRYFDRRNVVTVNEMFRHVKCLYAVMHHYESAVESIMAGNRTVVAVSGCCHRSASSAYGESSHPRPERARK